MLAALFVCLIVADLTLDGNCDPPPTLTSGAVALTAAPGGDATDACAQRCVPDCYCCSRVVSAAMTVAQPDMGPNTPAVAFAPPPAPDGVHPVPYHPPLRLA